MTVTGIYADLFLANLRMSVVMCVRVSKGIITESMLAQEYPKEAFSAAFDIYSTPRQMDSFEDTMVKQYTCMEVRYIYTEWEWDWDQ